MKIMNNQFPSIEQVTNQYLQGNTNTQKTETSDGLSFEEILKQKQIGETAEPLKFSKHAANRLADRQIELSRGQLDRLQEGTEKAQQKGIKESLVLVDQLAFIVNVPSSTVVTAMDRQDATENIFTNIDGAVII